MPQQIDERRVPPDFMGTIYSDVLLTNCDDRALRERGYISQEEVRSVEVTGIVDTGAVMLYVPRDIVDRLGLVTRYATGVQYADGRTDELPVAGPVAVTIVGRTMDTNCIVGSPGGEVLIGQIELERLDLVANCKNKTLMPNPNSPLGPMLPIYSTVRRSSFTVRRPSLARLGGAEEVQDGHKRREEYGHGDHAPGQIGLEGFELFVDSCF